MKLVIGGYAQGKLNYILQKIQEENCLICEECLPEADQAEMAGKHGKTIIINHFHNWVKGQLHQGGNPEDDVVAFLEKNPESIIISDEIGNGIVPIDAFERAYREKTGRLLVKLAAEADEVVRIICGIGQKIK